MNLKAFHIVFVTASSLMSFVFGGWCWRYAAANQSSGFRTLAAASLGVGLALIVYGFWFWKKISAQGTPTKSGKGGAIALILLVWFLAQPAAEACTTCYGEAEGPLIDAARAGVWLLFGLVGALQAAFIGFFIYLWRRSNGAMH